jgi:hypothetical protein
MFSKLKSFFKKKSSSILPLDRSKSSLVGLPLQIIERRKFGKDDEKSLVEQLVESDETHELNQKFIAYEEFNGPLEKREPTDKRQILVPIIIFLILLIQFIVFGLVGDPQRLAYGLDFRANSCGVGNLTAKPYLYYAIPNIDLNVNLCMSSCPNATNYEFCLYRPDGRKEHSESRFCYSTIQSKLYGKYCIPVEKMTRTTVMTDLNKIDKIIGRLLGDGYLCWIIIMGGFIGIMIILKGFTWLLQKPRIQVIFNIITLIGGCVVPVLFMGLFYFEYTKMVADQCYGKSTHDLCSSGIPMLVKIAIFFSIVIAGYMALYFMMHLSKFIAIFKLFNRLKLVLKSANQMKWIYFISNILIIITSVFAFFFVLFAYSAGSNSIEAARGIDGSKVKTFKSYLGIRIVLVFDLMLLAYLINFILNFNKATTVMIMTNWYFSRKKESAELPVLRSALLVLQKHIGSIAFYTTSISLFGGLKMISGFLFNGLKTANQSSDLVRFLISVFSPLLKLYHNFLRYIDIDFFQQTSLFGDFYSSSSKRTFFLKQSRNTLIDFKIFNWLENFFFYQKIFIIGSMSLLLYTAIYFLSQGQIFGLEKIDLRLTASILFFMFATYLADTYFDTYVMICKSICMCFLVDKEMFVGDQMYSEEILHEFIKIFEESGNNIAKDRRIFGINFTKQRSRIINAKIKAAQYFDDETEDDEKDMVHKDSHLSDEKDEIRSVKEKDVLEQLNEVPDTPEKNKLTDDDFPQEEKTQRSVFEESGLRPDTPPSSKR